MSSPTTIMTVSEIEQMRENVRRKLSKVSAFQIYEMLTAMLEQAHRGNDFKITQFPQQINVPPAPPDRPYLLTTPDQKKRIAGTAEDYFRIAANAPTTIRHLLTFLHDQGIEIPGKNPGTTLGAIISHNSTFEHCDKRQGLWRLTNEAYGREASVREAGIPDNQAP